MSVSHVWRTIEKALAENQRTEIYYDFYEGTLDINQKKYEVGKISFGKVGDIVLSTLKELYGNYETIPYDFKSEIYENKLFRAQSLTLSSIGLLSFTIERKRSLDYDKKIDNQVVVWQKVWIKES